MDGSDLSDLKAGQMIHGRLNFDLAGYRVDRNLERGKCTLHRIMWEGRPTSLVADEASG